MQPCRQLTVLKTNLFKLIWYSNAILAHQYLVKQHVGNELKVSLSSGV